MVLMWRGEEFERTGKAGCREKWNEGMDSDSAPVCLQPAQWGGDDVLQPRDNVKHLKWGNKQHKTMQKAIDEQPTLLGFLPSLSISKAKGPFSVVLLVPFLCTVCLQQTNCCHSDTLTQFSLRSSFCGVGERTDCACLWQYFVIEGTRSESCWEGCP